jgi:alpha-galactosidase/6-phospho-beta-glucosidase family protein
VTQVTIIGGGSYQWTPELLADLFGTPSLQGVHVVLEDIDPVPLAQMEPLAKKVSDALDAKATVATTTDQKAALEGADFVIVTISTGGFASMTYDLDIPIRYGIHQSVGDSVGPGGINRALRNIPILVDIARDMEEVCPDAWLLNITNPMTTLTRSVCRETTIKTVGLCHEVGNWCMDLAIALKKPHTSVRPTVAGVNHFPVVTALDVDGEDGFAILHDLIEELGGLKALAPRPGRPEAEPFSREDFAQRHLLTLTLFDQWGAIAAAGDRHLAEFLPSVLTQESGWGGNFNIELTSIAKRQAHQDGYIADVGAWLAGTKDLQTWQSGELPAPVIDSLLTGERRELPVNIPNEGQAPDLPDEVVVESMCVVGAKGIHGRDQARLPAPFAEVVRRHVAVQELTVEAALSGDRKLASAAFALDPLAGRGDLEATESMIDALLDATSSWLPQFAAAS